MENYLGEFPVDISKNRKFRKYTPTDWAMYFVAAYGQIDGDHHKLWVLDQVARCLKGVPVVVVQAKWSDGQKEYRVSTAEVGSEEYTKWVKQMKRGGYTYDEGIAP